MRVSTSKLSVVVSAVCLIGTTLNSQAFAQCAGQWDTGFASPGMIDPSNVLFTYYNGGFLDPDERSEILCAEMYDDGNGPRLYVGGRFMVVGGTSAHGVASTTDGTTWKSLGESLFDQGGTFSGTVIEDMVVFDPDGNGRGNGPAAPILVVAGSFYYTNRPSTYNTPSSPLVAGWNGTNWLSMGLTTSSPIAGSGEHVVKALAVFDSGDGDELYAGGVFSLNSIPNAGIAVYSVETNTWRPVGFVGLAPAWSSIDNLVVHDDGSGAALYASGSFSRIIGVPNSRGIARWNGSAWRSVGTVSPLTTANTSSSLVSFDPDGPGGSPAQLLLFSNCDRRLDTWNGTAWSSRELPGVRPEAQGFCYGKVGTGVFNDGDGPAVYFGATYNIEQPQPHQRTRLVKYDGTNFTPVGLPMKAANNTMPIATVQLVTVSGNAALFVATGVIEDPSTGVMLAGGMMKYSDSSLTSLAPIGGPAPDGAISGQFYENVTDLQAHDFDGPGPEPVSMIAVGGFHSMGGVVCDGIAARTGSSWRTLNVGLEDAVQIHTPSSLTFNSQSELYCIARAPHNGIEERSGVFKLTNNQWQPVGERFGFIAFGVNAQVEHIFAADFGLGHSLYAIGGFVSVDGVDVFGAARWNGSAWELAGDGFFVQHVIAAKIFDDGAGPAIFVHHNFGQQLTRWSGFEWTDASSGLPNNQPFGFNIVIFNGELWATNGHDFYAWSNEDAAWFHQAVTPDDIKDTIISFLGVATSDGVDRFLFILLDSSRHEYSYTINEFDGSSWRERSDLGRIIPETFPRNGNPLISPWIVRSVNTPGTSELWLAGPFWGVGGDFNPVTKVALNGVNSFHIAKWSCSTSTCVADFDNANGVTVQDIFAFLDAWFARNPTADINRQNGVEVNDIFDFLSAWFAGC